MSFIIVTRNPRTKRPIVVIDPDRDELAQEFPTKKAAHDAASYIKICGAWGYQVIEVADLMERQP